MFEVEAPAYPWHAGTFGRRRKTVEELLDGHEFTELFDRAHPGQLAAREAR
jgi:hypothetical protein